NVNKSLKLLRNIGTTPEGSVCTVDAPLLLSFSSSRPILVSRNPKIASHLPQQL
ncbi:hypothetical protein L9F63_006110, partial [Diploptera punctata]